MPNYPSRLRLFIGVCIAALVLFGCGATTSVVASAPTATHTPAPSCATILPGAAAAAAPAGFAGLTFPTGAVMTPLHASYGGTGQFAIQETDVCYAGTVDQVNGPYSGHSSVFAYLLGGGWGTSHTYPLDGQTQTPCSVGASCFSTPVESFLSFEHIATPQTGFVTYHLRLAAPPPVPTCNPTYYGPSVPYTYVFGNYNLPPLSKESDIADGGGYAGGYVYGLCSAGTPASILAFMQVSATAAGETPRQVTATSFCTSYTQGGAYGETVFTVSTGNEWSIRHTIPAASSPICS